MNIEEFRIFCLSLKAATESFPFGEEVMVFKVMDKMFCLISLDRPDRFNVKCDLEIAIELREQYDCVQPGYHMSKKMWNTIIMDGSVSKKQLQQWIIDSYDLIVAGLTKKKQQELAAMK